MAVAAAECGRLATVSRTFAKSLFFGEVAYDVAFPFPELGREERAQIETILEGIRGHSGRWAELRGEGSSTGAEANGQRPAILPVAKEIFSDCAALSIFASSIPETHGGAPLSHLGRARIFEGLGYEDLATGIALAMAATTAPLALVNFAKPELQAEWLPRMASGEVISAFALTENGAGSDAGGVHTRADREIQADGSAGDYVVRGEKSWVTNAHLASAFVVFARTSPTDEDAKPKLTALFAPRDATVTHDGTDATLGLVSIGCPRVTFHETRVPESAVLGEAGRGFRVAVELFNRSRIMLAAVALGAVKRTIRLVLRRCDERRAFGRNIGEFGLIKGRVSDLLVQAFALESLVYWTSGLADAEDADVSIESALCKIVAADVAESTTDHAFHIFASSAYLDASPVAELVRDVRALSVLQGTNDVLGCFVALSGMQEPGRDMNEVAKAMREPIKGFGLLSDFAIRRAREAFGRGAPSPVHPSLAREAALVETYAQELAKNSEKVLRRHGSNIAEMQFTQHRIADITRDLVLLVACLSRTTKAIIKRGEEGSRREIDMLRIFAAQAERRLAETTASFDKNEDELRKGVASRAYLDGAYPLEALES